MNIRKLFCPGNTPRILLFLFFFVVSAITTIACGYTEKNATGNVLLLFLLLLLAHRNTLTSITALLFLFCCALYAPAGMTYGKINNSFIVALLQTTTDEAAEFTGMIPVYHFLVSAAILVFMVIFWRTHHRGHRNWLALLLFVLCSVNSWPLRMVKGTVVGTTDTLREMQRYKQLNQHGADNWKILPGVPLYDTIVIVTGESVRRDYMSVYGYPVPTTPWLNTAPGLFIDGYTSAAASTVPSLSRTLIYDYEQNPDSGNNVVALAAKAGYSTWWISNQGKLGEHDTRISVIASDAEHTVFLKKGSFASRKTDDMLLLQETERALADKSSPKVIFLHMMGSHPNPCDRLHSWPNNYQEQFPRKIACYLASISKLDNFLGQLDGILRRHSRHFAMLYFSDHGLSVSDSANPVHHDGHVQGGYSVPLIITASDITSHQSVSRKISARHFAGYISNAVQGDFGLSMVSRRPVADEIASRFMPTLWLTITSMVWAVIFGMAAGIIAAVWRNRWPDRLSMTIAVSGISFPAFALGMLLIQVFSVELGWLPTVGADSWQHYILPSLTLGAAVAAVMARFTRASFVDVLSEDYMRTARAKGVSETWVVLKHGLRNAMIPVVTMMGLQFGFLLGGSIVVEKVFNWPGLGRLLVDSVEMRDYPVIQAEILLFSLEFILINLVVDVLYAAINPAIRYK